MSPPRKHKVVKALKPLTIPELDKMEEDGFELISIVQFPNHEFPRYIFREKK